MIDKKVVIGTIGSDAHMIGTGVLTRALRDAGFLNRMLLRSLVPEVYA